jgi:hypothetical protein
MKVIERSPIGGEGSSKSFADRVKGIWQFGLSWDQDIQAQRVLISKLGRVLDNSYTMISNVTLPGYSLPVPLVLIGHTGVRTLYVSAVKGIFRIKGDNWYKLDEKNESYKPSRPNLVRRTMLMSRAIIEYLKENGYFLDEYEAVLFFAQPGIYIDAPESPVRLLQSDGVDGYTANLKEESTVLDAREIQHISEILTKSKPAKPKRNEDLRSLTPPSETIGFGEFQMKVWQWIILFVLAIIMLITVIVTAVIIVNAV